MKKGWIIAISIVAGLMITALILCLALIGPDDEKDIQVNSGADAAEEYLASPDAVAGENNSEIETDMTPDQIAGYYMEDTDGWYYDFVRGGADGYDGTFTAGFDASHPTVADNPQKDFTAAGEWKLEKGEIKLFSNGKYQSSMWACGDYIVDSQVYFVGDIDAEAILQQAKLVCKPGNSGDTQILNLYNDGKMIMEIIRDAGDRDSESENQEENLPPYEMHAGTYEKKDNKIIVTVEGASQEFYIVEDGLANWIYVKKQ